MLVSNPERFVIIPNIDEGAKFVIAHEAKENISPKETSAITSNGTHVITPSRGYDAMREVEVDVNVDLKGSLQDKQVTITENSTTTIVADEGYEGLNSVEVNSEVYEGFDFSKIYDDDFTKDYLDQNVNQLYKDRIAYSKKIKDEWDINKTNLANKFKDDLTLVYLPDVDFSNATSLESFCYNAKNLQIVPKIIAPNLTTLKSAFFGCSSAKMFYIDAPLCVNWHMTFQYCNNATDVNINDISKWTATTNVFFNCLNLTNVRFIKWKSISITSTTSASKLSSESIKYIIWHALNGENTLGFENQGATSRTFQLHATPYASWEEWRTTKPSVEDCEFLGVDETEITKYGELTWEDIALNIKLITIAK